MALTALDIYKYLPKTNCKECKLPTCLAFAMALAQKKASLSDCPHVSEDSKAALEGASQPPIRLVTVGTREKKLEIGNETVMFRHELTFFHPTAIAIEVSDSLDDAALERCGREIRGLCFERVGEIIGVNLVAVRADSGDPQRFTAAVRSLMDSAGLPFVLMSRAPEMLEPALKHLARGAPLLYAADKGNVEGMAALAKAHSAPLAVTAESLDELAGLVEKTVSLGVKDIVLDAGSRDTGSILQDATIIRRAALKKGFRTFGYPTIVVASDPDPFMEAAGAATFISKYGGIVVVRDGGPRRSFPS